MNKISNFLCLSLLLATTIALGMNNPNIMIIKGPNDSEKQLIEAARNGNIEDVERLIAEGISIKVKTSFWGLAPLPAAAARGHVDICMLLIEKNALIEDKSLINAALNGHETVCRLLIEKNATVHGKNGFGWTPLLAAAFHGHEAISKLLIEKNAAIAAKAINGFTPLINAALNNHEGTCRLLIDTQLERARKKAGIKTFLGITRKRKTHLPCEMQWDIAIMIVRQALETIKQDKQSVIDQINGLNEQKKPKWLDYANQQINSPIK